ncbi:YfhO family protein [Rubrobacter marinus]|uniref:YfhO family protein n=1 Tax=Rubrobacter marinus TaxID=2653852 RepID=A0A6G8PU49_9ACTN|nr:YfhO family protein [Rubrobacter marinus]QIN77471.1 YfhO family protein [Rubrobacter marinus]
MTKFVRFRLLPAPPLADAAAVFSLLVLTAVAAWDTLQPGETFVGADAATQFYPWYAFLGESLRSGDVPGWNPHQFSGTPFAADPLSGWSYLPAMLLFTALPPLAAAKAYALFHLLLAGCATYALARVLEMGTAGALLSAVSYEFSGFLYVENTCCFAYASVMAWLPFAFLGAEGAVSSGSRLNRALWWGVSGLALSQILAAWLGQGSYYALLALMGYVAYRTVVSPPGRGVYARLSGTVLHAGGILVFGFGLAALGLLPRLEYNALSNLAGGYPDAKGAGGWTVEDWRLLLEPGLFYAGVTVLALALVAPFIARGRSATPYFAGLCLAALVLSGAEPTPLHSALSLLPRFGQLHPHFPERAMVVFFLGAALLAGATLSRLGEPGKKVGPLLSLPALATLLLLATRVPPSAALLLALTVANVLAAAYALLPGRRALWRGLAAGALAFVVFSDLFAAGKATLVEHGEAQGGSRLEDRVRQIDLAQYYRPTDAARFLGSRAAEPSRYLGYGPRTRPRRSLSSPVRFADPETQALGVNNRAMTSGLQSTGGYNAVRLARYDEYMRALNAKGQDYHYADVFEGGLDSPLLDLLNVRYVIVPAGTPPDGGEGVQNLKDAHPTVYEGDGLEVLENRGALPRAWIVHSARRAEPDEALGLLASGAVDPGETALLEETPPGLARPVDASSDRARVTEHGADRIELETTTGAPGLLVLSETYYPAWKAYVDGRPARLYRADHLLRAVPVPAGEHSVELRYESATLQLGIAVSSVVGAILVALAVAAVVRRRKKAGPRTAAVRYSMSRSNGPPAPVQGGARW